MYDTTQITTTEPALLTTNRSSFHRIVSTKFPPFQKTPKLDHPRTWSDNTFGTGSFFSGRCWVCVFNWGSFSSARASYVKWGIVCSACSWYFWSWKEQFVCFGSCVHREDDVNKTQRFSMRKLGLWEKMVYDEIEINFCTLPHILVENVSIISGGVRQSVSFILRLENL